MTLNLIMLAMVISTLLGGVVAYRYKKYTHIFAGLTAGTLLGVIFLEILPEILEMQEGATLPFIYVLVGFIVFHVIEKIFSLHHTHSEGEHENHDHIHHNEINIVDSYTHHGHITSKKTAAIALIIHSFFDGLAIVVAYKVSAEFGFLVALAVIAHDFSDGFNTVSLTKRSKSSKFFLGLDALAPVFGILVGSWLYIPDTFLAPILSICAGILLYVCTSDILPEAHCDKRRHMVEHLIALCVGVVYIAVLMMG